VFRCFDINAQFQAHISVNLAGIIVEDYCWAPEVLHGNEGLVHQGKVWREVDRSHAKKKMNNLFA